eukprot:4373298-Amphidinium_carterae.1
MAAHCCGAGMGLQLRILAKARCVPTRDTRSMIIASSRKGRVKSSWEWQNLMMLQTTALLLLLLWSSVR